MVNMVNIIKWIAAPPASTFLQGVKAFNILNCISPPSLYFAGTIAAKVLSAHLGMGCVVFASVGADSVWVLCMILGGLLPAVAWLALVPCLFSAFTFGTARIAVLYGVAFFGVVARPLSGLKTRAFSATGRQSGLVFFRIKELNCRGIELQAFGASFCGRIIHCWLPQLAGMSAGGCTLADNPYYNSGVA